MVVWRVKKKMSIRFSSELDTVYALRVCHGLFPGSEFERTPDGFQCTRHVSPKPFRGMIQCTDSWGSVHSLRYRSSERLSPGSFQIADHTCKILS